MPEITVYQPLTNKEKEAHIISYFHEIQTALNLLNIQEIVQVMHILEQAFLNGKKIFIAGNGGSAATSSHMVADLQKTTLYKHPQTKNQTFKFKAISLNDNIPVMTAWGNDEGFNYIFSQQLKVLGEAGDVLLIITGSGNSQNLLDTIHEAQKLEMTCVGFLGFDGGKAKTMLDYHILVASDKYGPIEDLHSILNHLITLYFQKQINTLYQ